MYNKYAAYPNRQGLVLVRDRWYNLVQVFGTDNLRAKIEWFEKFNVDHFQYQCFEMPEATRAELFDMADAIRQSQDEATMERMQHYAQNLPRKKQYV